MHSYAARGVCSTEVVSLELPVVPSGPKRELGFCVCSATERHHESGKYHQSIGKVQVKVLQNLIVSGATWAMPTSGLSSGVYIKDAQIIDLLLLQSQAPDVLLSHQHCSENIAF